MRLKLFEIHDQRWFPDFLRREVLDALQMILERTNAYLPIASRLRAALDYSGTCTVLDLFSGAGGPWPSLIRLYESKSARSLQVFLTDKFPAASNGCKGSSNTLHFIGESVDATAIPDRLHGFRTIFSSFHHFDPAQALCFLRESARNGQGIGVFEIASRHAFTLGSVFTMPVLDWLFVIFRRPFRWSRILWTYVVPIVPAVLFVDGLISCLRAYSLADLHAMTAAVHGRDYEWQIGEESSGLLPLRVTYLVGFPRKLLASN